MKIDLKCKECGYFDFIKVPFFKKKKTEWIEFKCLRCGTIGKLKLTEAIKESEKELFYYTFCNACTAHQYGDCLDNNPDCVAFFEKYKKRIGNMTPDEITNKFNKFVLSEKKAGK